MDTDKKPQAEWHDWVGDLFEPVFGATIEDLVSHEEDPKNKPRVKHISVHDPEAVRKVYEKVHMMTVLDEEMRKQQREERTKSALKQAVKTQDQPEILPVTESVLRPGQVTVDVNDSCIWDTNEISVLREAYKSLKQQSIDAMVCYRETTKRNNELEQLTSQQKQTMESQRLKLREAHKANKRLNIHVESLTEEVKYLTAKVGAMEEVIREIKTDQSDMVKELHDNRVMTDKERMERGRIQMKLDNLRKEALAEKLAAEDKIRTQCRKAIHDLKEQVKLLEKELKEEKSKRQITEKGLKHLRTHFSSLSVQEIMPSNVVDTDQVKYVQY
ncbi:coiled-coil domain-containing protein 160 homolog isoform X2 [Ruditapes philippinarum]|uniref:coiled-coil domain-containing protein 160 homolog isoform X2 n=1 Tax=Ruditapes philippinarum TaxID=129788 RepID=UPI00295BEA4B|nr:coiled-coil domain-containing protein 160 homolog isoform X2 [Ruditapes philippinarum]